jgi:hypothetical protein
MAFTPQRPNPSTVGHHGWDTSGCVIASILFSNQVASIRRIWVRPTQLRVATLGEYTMKYRTMFVAVAPVCSDIKRLGCQ